MASRAEEEVRRRIARQGAITFCEFMELALYWPQGGYYTTRPPSADYYTAPGAHPAFGALLCLQLCQMWQLLGSPRPFWVIEPGAGNGRLCGDVTDFASHLPPEFFQALRYLSIERHTARQHEAATPPPRGRERLAALGFPFRRVTGVVLSNELLDAFPAHRVKMAQGRLLEVWVTLEEGRLVEALRPPSTPALEERLRRVGACLADGWEAEVNLTIDGWALEASSCLDRGFVITLDYGRPAAELYSAHRPRGTLTTFRNHVQTDSPLRDVGYQDITAQVDFTALELAGEDAGLETWGRTSQRQFLLNMGIRRWLASLGHGDMPEAEANANRMGMQQLIRQGGMGDFQALFQAKGVEQADLWGLRPSPELDALVDSLPMPRLTAAHVPLMSAAYPHAAMGFEHLLYGDDGSYAGGEAA